MGAKIFTSISLLLLGYLSFASEQSCFEFYKAKFRINKTHLMTQMPLDFVFPDEPLPVKLRQHEGQEAEKMVDPEILKKIMNSRSHDHDKIIYYHGKSGRKYLILEGGYGVKHITAYDAITGNFISSRPSGPDVKSSWNARTLYADMFQSYSVYVNETWDKKLEFLISYREGKFFKIDSNGARHFVKGRAGWMQSLIGWEEWSERIEGRYKIKIHHNPVDQNGQKQPEYYRIEVTDLMTSKIIHDVSGIPKGKQGYGVRSLPTVKLIDDVLSGHVYLYVFTYELDQPLRQIFDRKDQLVFEGWFDPLSTLRQLLPSEIR